MTILFAYLSEIHHHLKKRKRIKISFLQFKRKIKTTNLCLFEKGKHEVLM